MCKHKDYKYPSTPPWMKRKRRATIEVDSCCEKVLLHLWAHHIDTLYHCCGHSFKKKAYLILSAGCTESIREVRRLIKQVDNRAWSIR